VNARPCDECGLRPKRLIAVLEVPRRSGRPGHVCHRCADAIVDAQRPWFVQVDRAVRQAA
jgi:hypothetical protein